MYMTLHRVNQMLVHPRWTRLAFDHHRTPRILDEPVEIDIDVGEVEEISVAELWKWAQADSHAAYAWQAAIEEYEASCREAMYQKWLGLFGEHRNTRAWACHARAAQARSDGHAWEIRAFIAAHDAA